MTPQTENVIFKMRRSFSWDKAFFTNDGFLDAEELSSMIEGGGNDENDPLEKLEEIENLEAKLFQEIEASNKKSNSTSNTTISNIKQVSVGKKDSQTKKVTGAGGTRRAAPPVKTPPTRSSPSSGGSGSSPNLKPATLQKRSKIGSKTPPGITTKNKVSLVNTRLPKTSPASPISPGSSGSSSSSTKSTFSVNRRSKRASSVPRRSIVSNEKPSTNKGRTNDAQKADKPLGGLMPKTISNISLKNKPPPVNSHPLSPLGLSNSSPDSIRKQPAALRSKTGSVSRPTSAQPLGRGMPSLQHSKPGSPNDGKSRKLPTQKTVTVNKLNSQKTTTVKPSEKQSSGNEKRSSSVSRYANSIFVMSPEVLDIKGKINALKMEISMQKKDRCIKTHAESVKGESSSSLFNK